MQTPTRRNLAFLALGVAFLVLLWQVPGRGAPQTSPAIGFGTPRPTPTVETHWQPVYELRGDGSRDLCAERQEVTVPGPWRLRAEPAERSVQVRVLDKHNGRLYARVWASGLDRGALATLPQGNGTYCLQVEADGAYTLWVEAWEAPRR